MLHFFILISAFLLGSIPTGVWLSKLFGLPDPRSFGSGNTGASNLARLGGIKIGALTFLIDFFKGFLPTLAAQYYFPDEPSFSSLACLLAVTSHCYSFFLKFNGGKGVATACGGFFILCPIPTAIGLTVWLLVFYAKKITSLAAFFALAGIHIGVLFFPIFSIHQLVLILVTLLIFRRHETNLLALLNNEERGFAANQS